jgi:hypothetical protein
VPTIAAIVIVSVATAALVSVNLAVARLAAARIAVGTNEALGEPVPAPDPLVAKRWRMTTRRVRGAQASQIVSFGDFRNTV